MQRNELVNLANSLGFDSTTIANDSKLEAHLKYLQANQSTMAGTLASGTITASGIGVDTQTITIGSVVYTLVTALSETKASSTLTSDATAPDDGDTVTVDGITYTFRTTLTNTSGAPYEVLIGASAAAALDNLKKAINDSGTEGTHYGEGTDAHPTVTAEANADTTQEVTAKNFGTYANNFVTLETSAHLAWDDTTLGGASATPGVDAVPNEVLLTATAATELDNLKQAINYGDTEGGSTAEGEGTNYSTGTRPHPQVTATTNAATTQLVVARDMAVGEDVATTETCTDWAWGATTLASGVADQNAVNAAAVAQTGKGQNANT